MGQHDCIESKIKCILFGKVKSYLQMFVRLTHHSIISFPDPDFPLPPNVCHVHLADKETICAGLSVDLFLKVKCKQTFSQVLANTESMTSNHFAHLLPEEVQGYDWWGHVDNDFVLGDVCHFIANKGNANQLLCHYAIH